MAQSVDLPGCNGIAIFARRFWTGVWTVREAIRGSGTEPHGAFRQSKSEVGQAGLAAYYASFSMAWQ